MSSSRSEKTQGGDVAPETTADSVTLRRQEAAKRALAEAEERRKKTEKSDRPKEVGGPSGPEPTRYGDWEKGGIASDF